MRAQACVKAAAGCDGLPARHQQHQSLTTVFKTLTAAFVVALPQGWHHQQLVYHPVWRQVLQRCLESQQPGVAQLAQQAAASLEPPPAT